MLKQTIKKKILEVLHSVPEQEVSVLEHLITQGISNYLEFSYPKFMEKTLGYIDSLRVAPYVYRFASSTGPSLYASIYACMLLGLFGEIDRMAECEKREWKEYFDSFQSEEDGLFYSEELNCEEYLENGTWGDGWGKRHLAGHIIIAYKRLGFLPRYRISCYDDLYDESTFQKWIEQFQFRDKAWSESNYIMNAYVVLQYNRDFFHDERAGAVVERIKKWLSNRQNPESGMWNAEEIKNADDLNVAIRAAYHLYPLFEYDNENAFSTVATIDYILRSENKWGGFTTEGVVAGACEDIDAIDPLIRCALQYKDYKTEEIHFALKKSMIWVLSNFNNDGGATFYIENEHHYGDHPLTTSLKNESNLFATWFRTLSLVYICQYLDLPNSFSITRNPGYENCLRGL